MSRKKEKVKKEIVKTVVNIKKDDKQARVLVVLTSVLFAAIATLFYILDWTLEWGLIKIVSCILVDIWMFFLPPAIRLSYLKNEGKTPGQWFMMGYHGGASGLWMPVLLAPLFGILYFLPRTYKKKGEEGEEPLQVSDAEQPAQERPEVQSTMQPEEKVAVESPVPVATEGEKTKEVPAVVVVAQAEKKEPAPSVQPEVKVVPVTTAQVQPEVKVVPVTSAQPEVKAPVEPPKQEIKVEVVPLQAKAEPVAPLPEPQPITVEIVED